MDRREALKRGAVVAGGVVWAAPAVQAVGVSRAFAQSTSPPTTGDPILRIDKVGPPGVFAGQEFDWTITVSNVGIGPAMNVVLVDTLPTEGSFVSSNPPGVPVAGVLTLNLGDIAPSDSVVVTVRWLAPSNETTLVNTAVAGADNHGDVQDIDTVDVGAVTTGRGDVTAAGTSLRNRDGGDIAIAGVPAGATITRAVLVWVILHNGIPANPDKITLDGTEVTANVSAVPSGTLCWGDSQTIGYASDVTALVVGKGNGTYRVSNAINGVKNLNSTPSGVLPYTDGATLFVYWAGGGSDAQVISDFTYSTNTAPGGIDQTISGINSVGLGARLWTCGADGQSAGDTTTIMNGSGSIVLSNLWDGSDPNDGDDLTIGNLWDTDLTDVSGILPAGQTEINLTASGSDCIGLAGMVVSVDQS